MERSLIKGGKAGYPALIFSMQVVMDLSLKLMTIRKQFVFYA